MIRIKALDLAIRRLDKSQKPSMRAADIMLADLRTELIPHEELARAARIAAFRAKLPRAA
jgi:hypothetical protein